MEGGNSLVYHALPLGGREKFSNSRPGGRERNGISRPPKKTFQGGRVMSIISRPPRKTFQGGCETSVITRPPFFFFFNFGVREMELKGEGGNDGDWEEVGKV